MDNFHFKRKQYSKPEGRPANFLHFQTIRTQTTATNPTQMNIELQQAKLQEPPI